MSPDSKSSSLRNLILWPAIITLAVTIVRLAGELGRWSSTFFDRSAGGGNAIVGITWLAPLFGIYFAVRLVRSGHEPASYGKAVGFSVVAAAIAMGLFLYGSALTRITFHEFLFYVWGVSLLGALLVLPAWWSLFKTLLAYAYAARIPVAIIMFLAMRGNWGTHYDVAPLGVNFAGLWSRYLWLGFFPQLIFWVGYTVVSGMLFGSLAAGLIRPRRRASAQAARATPA